MNTDKDQSSNPSEDEVAEQQPWNETLKELTNISNDINYTSKYVPHPWDPRRWKRLIEENHTISFPDDSNTKYYLGAVLCTTGQLKDVDNNLTKQRYSDWGEFHRRIYAFYQWLKDKEPQFIAKIDPGDIDLFARISRMVSGGGVVIEEPVKSEGTRLMIEKHGRKRTAESCTTETNGVNLPKCRKKSKKSQTKSKSWKMGDKEITLPDSTEGSLRIDESLKSNSPDSSTVDEKILNFELCSSLTNVNGMNQSMPVSINKPLIPLTTVPSNMMWQYDVDGTNCKEESTKIVQITSNKSDTASSSSNEHEKSLSRPSENLHNLPMNKPRITSTIVSPSLSHHFQLYAMTNTEEMDVLREIIYNVQSVRDFFIYCRKDELYGADQDRIIYLCDTIYELITKWLQLREKNYHPSSVNILLEYIDCFKPFLDNGLNVRVFIESVISKKYITNFTGISPSILAEQQSLNSSIAIPPPLTKPRKPRKPRTVKPVEEYRFSNIGQFTLQQNLIIREQLQYYFNNCCPEFWNHLNATPAMKLLIAYLGKLDAWVKNATESYKSLQNIVQSVSYNGKSSNDNLLPYEFPQSVVPSHNTASYLNYSTHRGGNQYQMMSNNLLPQWNAFQNHTTLVSGYAQTSNVQNLNVQSITVPRIATNDNSLNLNSNQPITVLGIPQNYNVVNGISNNSNSISQNETSNNSNSNKPIRILAIPQNYNLVNGISNNLNCTVSGIPQNRTLNNMNTSRPITGVGVPQNGTSNVLNSQGNTNFRIAGNHNLCNGISSNVNGILQNVTSNNLNRIPIMAGGSSQTTNGTSNTTLNKLNQLLHTRNAQAVDISQNVIVPQMDVSNTQQNAKIIDLTNDSISDVPKIETFDIEQWEEGRKNSCRAVSSESANETHSKQDMLYPKQWEVDCLNFPSIVEVTSKSVEWKKDYYQNVAAKQSSVEELEDIEYKNIPSINIVHTNDQFEVNEESVNDTTNFYDDNLHKITKLEEGGCAEEREIPSVEFTDDLITSNDFDNDRYSPGSSSYDSYPFVSENDKNEKKEEEDKRVAEIPCSRCKKSAIYTCSRCQSIAYCSDRCATLHWKSDHRYVCQNKGVLNLPTVLEEMID